MFLKPRKGLHAHTLLLQRGYAFFERKPRPRLVSLKFKRLHSRIEREPGCKHHGCKHRTASRVSHGMNMRHRLF